MSVILPLSFSGDICVRKCLIYKTELARAHTIHINVCIYTPGVYPACGALNDCLMQHGGDVCGACTFIQPFCSRMFLEAFLQ